MNSNKKVSNYIKLQIPAGKANPSPPVGPVLGQNGLNIMEFCKTFNDATKKLESGILVPVVITVYVDKSFDFKIKSPPASVLLKKMAGLDKGSSEPNKNKVAKISLKQIKEIVKAKNDVLTSKNEEAGIKMIMGTARSMGIEIN